MIQLTDAAFIVNNETVPTIPGSISFTEGLGEQDMKAASIGGGAVEVIYSNNITTNFSMVKAELPATPEIIALIRQWKLNRNSNVVQIISETAEGNLYRTFARAALTGNYEISIAVDGSIPIEFKSLPAV